MLDEIGIEYFKGIRQLEKLKIKPITLFCGKNSSGKTSILESILLLKQSSEKAQYFKKLILNGKYVRLGAFKDISWNNDEDGKIIFNFKLRNLGWNKRKKKDSEFSVLNLKFQRKDNKTLFDDVTLNQIFLKINEKDGIKSINIDTSNPNKTILKWDIGKNFLLDISKHQGQINYHEEYTENYFQGFHEFEDAIIFIRRKKLKIDDQQYYQITQKKYHLLIENKEKFKSIIKQFPNIEEEHIKDTIFELKNLVKERTLTGRIRFSLDKLEEQINLKKLLDKKTIKLYKNILDNIDEELMSDINDFFYEISSAINKLSKTLNKISFIGPLREEPSLRYTCEDQKLEIGNRGENAPLIFESEKTLKTKEFFLMEQGRFKKLRNKKFSEIWNLWSKYFNFGLLNSKSTSDSMFRFRIDEHNLKHVGFGISQVFPILIEGVRIEKGDTLILEQPEIHLHPDLQMRLADFFISMGISGRNTIIETHSEHIINRIVRRVVEDNTHKLIDLIAVYFVNMGKNGLEIEEIKIDHKGIVNWPKGFFDEAMREQSAIIKKIRENKNKEE
ncbi:DUF3696 domain-containing protein [Promethearchaeum syntrophicum]|uniref:DUF3696 domain-containing protein n=1 Tax=Promethearchaeum syntrophicum TaxID=2594042 RepID=A0A5B9DD10_9ARCH|nr:DUF3696 domain-containing protein [Candidatus Prometheoarchaeum syntrophicum]QEE17014.1 hypothetical protein DSAG12_02846 [Candidatus Prometheoarchaeum syntrophicum]